MQHRGVIHRIHCDGDRLVDLFQRVTQHVLETGCAVEVGARGKDHRVATDEPGTVAEVLNPYDAERIAVSVRVPIQQIAELDHKLGVFVGGKAFRIRCRRCVQQHISICKTKNASTCYDVRSIITIRNRVVVGDSDRHLIADDAVIGLVAREHSDVDPGPHVDGVITRAAGDAVIAVARRDSVVLGSGFDGVIAITTVNDVNACQRNDTVIATKP